MTLGLILVAVALIVLLLTLEQRDTSAQAANHERKEEMKMLQLVMLVCVGAFATAAMAQTCDVTLTTALTYKGAQEATNVVHYPALDRALWDALNQRLAVIVKAGLNAEEKGGDYTVNVGGTVVCDGKPMDIGQGGPANVEFRGVKPRGVVRIIRASINDADLFLLKVGDDAHKRGKKKAWGKE